MTIEAPFARANGASGGFGRAQRRITDLVERNARRYGPLPAVSEIHAEYAESHDWFHVARSRSRSVGSVSRWLEAVTEDDLLTGARWAQHIRTGPGDRVLVSTSDAPSSAVVGLAHCLFSGACWVVASPKLFVDKLRLGSPTIVIGSPSDWSAVTTGLVAPSGASTDDPIEHAAAACSVGRLRATIGLDECRVAASTGIVPPPALHVLAELGIELISSEEGLIGLARNSPYSTVNSPCIPRNA